ncbi:RTA1 like protein-domain-containing protein [Xylariaceae sp. FL1019]|nr:RTA1 like protein-domain-containing protein [Xylariaceae sp. FL1019]
MEDGQFSGCSIWFYAPNKGAPIFFTIAFLGTGATHFHQAVHYQAWRLVSLYVFCSLLFVGGFVTRALSAWHCDDIINYIVSIVLIYAAPPLYELGNYYILGRVLYFVPYYSPIHPGRVLTTFTAISTVIEALNGTGAAYVANVSLPKEKQELGRILFKVALVLQLVVVSLFVTLAATFDYRCRKNGIRSHKVHQPLLTLYLSSGIIAVRCIYRTVEYFGGETLSYYAGGVTASDISPVVRYEWFFYVFEAALMLINSVLFNVRHPRRWLPKSTKLYLAKDGSEMMGPGYKEDRNFIATLLDPFDVYGMINGRNKETRFWD